MLQTFNISLPENLSDKVEKIIEQEGYASRSEFFRTLLRFYLQMSTLKVKKSQPFFLPFKKQPLIKVKKELTESGLYNQKFIDSVVNGLKKSTLYANKTFKS